MNFKELTANILFPPKCVACGEVLEAAERGFGMGYCLCPVCYSQWRIAKEEKCPECLCPSHMCLCIPEDKRLNGQKMPKLFTYRPQYSDIQNQMIYAMKKINDKRICDFVSEELSISIGRFLRDEGISPDDCIYTYVPRRGRSVAEFGFDQGKRLSLNICRIHEGESISLLTRYGGREQKKLNKTGRMKNTDVSIFLKNKAEERICGRTVVIIDDLVTTGATLGRAAQLIERAGAERVLVACVAKTYEMKK